MVKISVILPTYNRLATLPRAVESVLRQTFSDFDLWIIDDGSTDSTSEWVGRQFRDHLEDKKINLITLPSNQGVSASRNVGILQSRSEWIAFLDSDDEWLPEKLERQMEWAERNPNEPLIHGEEIWIRNGVRVNPMKKHQKFGGRIFDRCIPLCCISPSTAMIRREVFEEVGLFREDFPVCEDYEMWLRICARWDVGYVPEPLIKKYGGHEDQLSRRFVAMDYWRVLALEPYLTSPLISTRERNLVRETIEQKSEILLRGYRKHDNFEHFHVVEALHERVKKSPDFLLNHE